MITLKIKKIGKYKMNEEIEDMIEEEIMIRVEELRKAMDSGNYKRANEILEMLLYCKAERDDKDVMVA